MNIIQRIKEYFFPPKELTLLEKVLIGRLNEEPRELKLDGKGTVKFQRQTKIELIK